ncbi:MAG: hypothetical protein ACFFDB_00525 [Promethearchaeota archaeon]
MITLPKEDLKIYQAILEIEISKDIIKENFLLHCREFRENIELIQNCKFWELDTIFSKDPLEVAKYFLEWLKFNFIWIQKENEAENKFYNLDEVDLMHLYLSSYEFDSFEDFKRDFEDRRQEYKQHKRIGVLKQSVIRYCEDLLDGIRIKNEKHIPNALKKIAFPEAYKEFQKMIPKMIEYKKTFGKRVFWGGAISKQFLKWLERFKGDLN